MELVGKTVKKVGAMDNEMLEALGWEEDCYKGRPVVIEFDDGTILYAASDDEGNSYGILNWGTTEACGLLCTDAKGVLKTVTFS